jgi:predicted patatin/cPLA2 family phospholipase
MNSSIVNKNNGKSALVVEGGGMRGIFAAGVLNAFGKAAFDPFDLYIGVSAGACHLASHLAGQHDRNFDITLRYSINSEFIDPWRFLNGGHLMDLDWMWEQTIKHYRLNLAYLFSKLRSQKKEYIVVATSMATGQALYTQPDENTLEHYLKVSSALPIFYRSTLEVEGEKAVDGGIADSIPVREAYRRGATDITVIRSRSASYVKRHSRVAAAIVSLYFRKYQRLVEMFRKRAENYNASVEFINNPPPGVRITEIAPPENIAIGRTTKNEASLRAAYETGIDYGNESLKTFHLNVNNGNGFI